MNKILALHAPFAVFSAGHYYECRGYTLVENNVRKGLPLDFRVFFDKHFTKIVATSLLLIQE